MGDRALPFIVRKINKINFKARLADNVHYLAWFFIQPFHCQVFDLDHVSVLELVLSSFEESDQRSPVVLLSNALNHSIRNFLRAGINHSEIRPKVIEDRGCAP